MKSKLDTSNILLGAALAGLALTPAANAATVIVTESTDFSNSSSTPTDLTASFADFALDSGVSGTIDTIGDFGDSFSVTMTPGVLVSIPVVATGSTPGSISSYLYVYDSSNGYLTSVNIPNFTDGGSGSGSVNFTVPANGIAVFSLSQESSAGSVVNYSVGAVPEPGTALLGLAGLAAAALRRKRGEA